MCVRIVIYIYIVPIYNIYRPFYISCMAPGNDHPGSSRIIPDLVFSYEHAELVAYFWAITKANYSYAWVTRSLRNTHKVPIQSRNKY